VIAITTAAIQRSILRPSMFSGRSLGSLFYQQSPDWCRLEHQWA